MYHQSASTELQPSTSRTNPPFEIPLPTSYSLYSPDCTITSEIQITAPLESVIGALRSQIEDTFDVPHLKDHRGVMTYLKPMSSNAEK